MKALRLLFADTFKVRVAPISLDIMDIFNSFPSTLISATHSVRRGKWGGEAQEEKWGENVINFNCHKISIRCLIISSKLSRFMRHNTGLLQHSFLT